MHKLSDLKISPAPWTVDKRAEDWVIVRDAKGKWVTMPDGDEETEALSNARLIAAAPELYKWLASAVEYYKCDTRSCDKCPNGKCWIVDATAALAKAAGEEVGDGQSS